MKPIWQKVINVNRENGTAFVESAKGNRYPVMINRLVKNVKEGDNALVVKSLSGEWVIIDTVREQVSPQLLDISVFPKDSHGDYNWVEYLKYRKTVEDKNHSEIREINNYFLNKWEALGYDSSAIDEEPHNLPVYLQNNRVRDSQ